MTSSQVSAEQTMLNMRWVIVVFATFVGTFSDRAAGDVDVAREW